MRMNVRDPWLGNQPEVPLNLFTVSLPRLINFEFPLQPHQNITSHNMTNLAFHSFHRIERLLQQFSPPHLYISLYQVWRMYFLNLRVKGLKADDDRTHWAICCVEDWKTREKKRYFARLISSIIFQLTITRNSNMVSDVDSKTLHGQNSRNNLSFLHCTLSLNYMQYSQWVTSTQNSMNSLVLPQKSKPAVGGKCDNAVWIARYFSKKKKTENN